MTSLNLMCAQSDIIPKNLAFLIPEILARPAIAGRVGPRSQSCYFRFANVSKQRSPLPMPFTAGTRPLCSYREACTKAMQQILKRLDNMQHSLYSLSRYWR